MALRKKITVQVEYLGFAAGLAGKKDEQLTLEDENSLLAQLEFILNNCQPLSRIRSSLIVAVNRKVIQPDGEKRTLVDGDRVSIGLKVSGG